MSSRNRYLSLRERQTAARLPQVLAGAAAEIGAAADIAATCARAKDDLLTAGFQSVDYLGVRTSEQLVAIDRHETDVSARIFVAAHLGRARLIDNMPIQSSPIG